MLTNWLASMVSVVLVLAVGRGVATGEELATAAVSTMDVDCIIFLARVNLDPPLLSCDEFAEKQSVKLPVLIVRR